MEITVYRERAFHREPRSLPAETYNLARSIQARSPQGIAFVPIRSMQVLAILDRDEFVFLDSQYKNWAMLAWQCFRSDERAGLDDPVAYELAFYTPEADAAMKTPAPGIPPGPHGPGRQGAHRRPGPGAQVRGETPGLTPQTGTINSPRRGRPHGWFSCRRPPGP